MYTRTGLNPIDAFLTDPLVAWAVGTFLAMAALDFVWTKYTYSVTKKYPHWASGWASAIALLAGAAQIAYTKNPWLLIPAVLGAYAGTYLAVEWEKTSGKT